MQLLALRRVLAAIDLDGSSRPALTSARDLAKAAGAEFHVLHAAPEEADAASLARELNEAGISSRDVQSHPTVGDPARAIALVADKVRADVIVLGPHRERKDEPLSLRLGSTALTVVTNAAVPCLVAARPLQLPLDAVVVGTDLSDTALGTLHVALSWASALRPRDASPTVLTALNVIQRDSTTQIAARTSAVEDALAPVRNAAGDWAGVTLRAEVIQAESPASGIAEYAEAHSSGLVALGTRGLGLDPVGRLGSVSADIMRRVSLPVLLVPPAVWKHHLA